MGACTTQENSYNNHWNGASLFACIWDLREYLDPVMAITSDLTRIGCSSNLDLKGAKTTNRNQKHNYLTEPGRVRTITCTSAICQKCQLLWEHRQKR